MYNRTWKSWDKSCPKACFNGRNYFFLKSGAIAEVFHVGSNDLYSWNILLPHQLYSFFKEPFDSKMIKIHYCRRNISRENRRIKRSELLHKIRYLEINDGVK